MNVDKLRQHLTMLKKYIDKVDEWVNQTNEIIYQIEEDLFDIKDKEFSQNYETKDNMKFLKEAASRMYQMIDSVPTQNPGRCGKYHSAAAGFYQSQSNFKKVV